MDHEGRGIGSEAVPERSASRGGGVGVGREGSRGIGGDRDAGGVGGLTGGGLRDGNNIGLSLQRPSATQESRDDEALAAARRNINTSATIPALAVPAPAATAPAKPKPSRVAFKSPAPSSTTTFWNDKKSMDQPRDMTFYREGTPPPSPPEMRYHSRESSSTHTYNHSATADSMYHAPSVPTVREPYDYKYDHIAPPAPIPRPPGRFGMSSRKLWLIILAVAVVVILAVGIGVGVGVGSKKNDGNGSTGGESDGDSDGSVETETPSSTTSTTSSESSSETPTSTSTELPTSSSEACPTANNTIFEVEGSDKSFLRLCGLDYSDADTDDLATVWTANVQDCITNCAGYPGCIGAGWGVIEGDTGDNHRCWMKRTLGEPHEVREGWDFAILRE